METDQAETKRLEPVQQVAAGTQPILKQDNFEQITRWIRWFVIGSVVVSFPYAPPQVYYLYGLAAAAALYNFCRYIPAMMRIRWFASTPFMLVVDNLFLVALIALTGNIVTPFSAFTIYPIIAASYRYKLAGTLLVTLFQMISLTILSQRSWFPAINQEPWQIGIITAAIPIGVGVFVERLTRLERKEKSELERLSHDLEAGQKHLMTLLDSLEDAIFVVDRNGIIQESNAAAESIATVEGDLKGTKFWTALPLRPRANLEADPVDILKESGPQHRRDLSVKAANGAVTALDTTVTPVRLEGRRTTDYIIVCRDITRERSIDEERSDFISVVSHELRTPITIMEASLSVIGMQASKLDPQARDLIKQAHDQSIQLGSIIKDLSMIAEANNDNLPVEFEEIDPAELVSQLAKDFGTQANQKGLEIVTEVPKEPHSLLSTKTHIVEVLQNYMTNAIKYSKHGKIVIKAEPTKVGGIVFSVKDNGIGIAPADQKHLFKKFFRSEDFRTRQTGGTGLGLYLSQEIAQRLGGRVWCRSELNEGSTFFLEIPPVSRLKRDQKEAVEAEVANLVDSI